MTTIKVRGLGKSFGVVNALHGLDLDIRSGEVLALLGENGAGKSTLLKILSGDYSPSTGSISVDGSTVSFKSTADAKRLGIHVIAQEPEVLPDVSVAENIYLGNLPSVRGTYRRRDVEQLATQQLDRFGFGQVLDASAFGRSLSPAQRQVVEIMRALVVDPTVLAFDEPTSSLTENEVNALFDLIERLRESGVAILYVSHRMQEIFRIADRVAVLRDGQLAGVRELASTTEAELVRLMVGRDLSSVFTRTRAKAERVVLEVDGLSNDVIHDVSLTVRSGEVVAVAGLIGAGRSEMARTVFGDLPRRSGSVTVDGRPVRGRVPRDAIDAGIGFAPEERKAQALLMQRSVRDNMSLAILDRLSTFSVVRRAEERSVVGTLVDRMRIRTPTIEQEIGKLSGGNQQKVVVGRWMARKPSLLILDEPTRGVDVGAKAEIYAAIDELAASGLAVLVISSELPEVLGIADRILVMRDGRIVGELSHHEATQEAILSLCLPHDEPPLEDLP